MPTSRVANSAMHGVDRLISNKDEFKKDINKLNANNKVCASVLVRDGDIESGVRRALEEEDPEAWNEFKSFLSEQRGKVKGLTESHIDLHRKVNSFIGAVQEVKQDMISSSQQNPSNDGAPADYEIILQTKIELLKQKLDDQAEPVANEMLMVKIKDALGEPTANDDDDIQVEMSNQDSAAQFTCPITQRLMEKPMKNSVCGHFYDLEGFKFWMQRRRTRKCPISGCANSHACMSQLEEDVEVQLRLKRFVKRRDQEGQNRINQTQDLDQSFEEMGDQNTTILE